MGKSQFIDKVLLLLGPLLAGFLHVQLKEKINQNSKAFVL
jgi:hypothetical protein